MPFQGKRVSFVSEPSHQNPAKHAEEVEKNDAASDIIAKTDAITIAKGDDQKTDSGVESGQWEGGQEEPNEKIKNETQEAKGNPLHRITMPTEFAKALESVQLDLSKALEGRSQPPMERPRSVQESPMAIGRRSGSPEAIGKLRTDPSKGSDKAATGRFEPPKEKPKRISLAIVERRAISESPGRRRPEPSNDIVHSPESAKAAFGKSAKSIEASPRLSTVSKIHSTTLGQFAIGNVCRRQLNIDRSYDDHLGE